MLNPKFLERMKEYLKEDYDSFIKSYDLPNIRAFRINDKYLTSKQFLSIAPFKMHEIKDIDGAFVVDEDIKFGFSPLHHAGAIYLQDPSAMLPTKIYDGLKNVKLALDLCASPGGKTIDLALNIDGVLISNEIDFKRSKILYSNVERMGLKNVIVTNNKAEDFIPNFSSAFDLILVDAPCSGEGMFRKYPESADLWSLDNIKLCHNRDVEILDTASKLLKKDGILIYSTCTFAKEENEEIVNYLISKGFTLLEGSEIVKNNSVKGFIDNTYRIMPNGMFGEGQFMALLRKNDGDSLSPKLAKNKDVSKPFIDFTKEYLNQSINYKIINDTLFYNASNFDFKGLNVLNYGAKLGSISNGRFIPDHYMFKAFPECFNSSVNLKIDDSKVASYLHGEQLSLEAKKGYGVLMVEGIPLGGYKASNGVLNNLYPKGLRNF